MVLKREKIRLKQQKFREHQNDLKMFKRTTCP